MFDGESFWHVLHGTLPRIFGGQFIQFRKKAEDFCKRLHDIGYRLAFVFGNSPISAEAKVRYLRSSFIQISHFISYNIYIIFKSYFSNVLKK